MDGTDRGLEHGPWLRPVRVETVVVSPSITEAGSEVAGLQTGFDAPELRLGIPVGPLLPRWWVEKLQREEADRFEKMASTALRAHQGELLSFQQESEGLLGRTDPPGWAPRQAAERKALDPSQRERLVQPGGILDAFLELERDLPAAAADFARRFGLLRICRSHGAPFRYCELYRPHSECWPAVAESLLYWGYCLAFIQAAQRTARSLSDGEPEDVPIRHWAFLGGVPPEEIKRKKKWMRERQNVSWDAYGSLVREIERWLIFGDVRLRLRWRPGQGATLEEGGRGTFGALAKSLVYDLARAERRIPCAECGKPIVPAQKPSAGKRAFCTKCRDRKAPQKFAMRDLRARKKLLRRIVEERLDDSASLGQEGFWERVQAEWRRENQLEYSPEELQENYFKWWGDGE